MSGFELATVQPLDWRVEVMLSSISFCVKVTGDFVPSASWNVWNWDQLIVWS